MKRYGISAVGWMAVAGAGCLLGWVGWWARSADSAGAMGPAAEGGIKGVPACSVDAGTPSKEDPSGEAASLGRIASSVPVASLGGPNASVPGDLILGGEGFPAGRTSVRDYGARGDGQADDAEAVQRAVEASPGIVYFPPGTYRLGKPIVVELDRVGPVSIVGSRGVRIVMAGAGPAFRLVGTHQGTASPETVQASVWKRQRAPSLEALEIVGEHPEASGIQSEGVMQLQVDRVLLRQVLHGVHLVRRNRNVIISQCHIYDNRGVGVFLDDVDLHQINIVGSHISYNKGGGIVSRAGNVRNLQVAGCDIEINGVNVLLDATGSHYGTAEVAITGCTIQHGGVENSANIRILGAGQKYRWGHVCITGNVFSDVDCNVHLRDAEDVVLTGNTFWMAYQYNLLAEHCVRLAVMGNVFGRNPGYDYVKQVLPNALRLVGCRDVVLQGLVVHDVQKAEAGLVLEDCERVNMVGCTFVDCSGPGLLLKNVSRSRVSDCLVDHADPPPHWVAIQVQGGQENLLTGNLLGGILEMEPASGQATGNLERRRAEVPVPERPSLPELPPAPGKAPLHRPPPKLGEPSFQSMIRWLLNR